MRPGKELGRGGRVQASEKLLQAIQLRYLQTLNAIAGDKSNTIVFPLPMELLKPLSWPCGRPGRGTSGSALAAV